MTLPFRGTDFDLPSGVIIPWQGTVDQLPQGWLFCDGNNGTPDLRSRYPKSVPDGTTDPGKSGGKSSKTLSNSQLPSHSHSGSVDKQTTDHSHYFTSGYEAPNDADDIDIFDDGEGSSTSITAGQHSHPISVGTTGGDQSIDNEPNHIEIGFIQRL